MADDEPSSRVRGRVVDDEISGVAALWGGSRGLDKVMVAMMAHWVCSWAHTAEKDGQLTDNLETLGTERWSTLRSGTRESAALGRDEFATARGKVRPRLSAGQ